jgi:hypothetical protein
LSAVNNMVFFGKQTRATEDELGITPMLAEVKVPALH